MSRLGPGRSFVLVRGADDGMAHLVGYRLYESGLIGGEGRYLAVCGRTVLAAAMAAEPGRVCRLCRAQLTP
ncbi:hypothetical protein [Pseudonocardia humida]|uniref:Uncharacterized protein n=1 Tax=Pseudonocardia humida TaxID=2800819 RepID=A0ABT1A7V8_9PSEU|nr:hypothetical protein [Pseudonocardia humida]MCO1659116.1 hypothetical protein [Pseudonocardia humida]